MAAASDGTMAQTKILLDSNSYGDLPARKLREPYKKFFGEDPPVGFQ